MTKLEEFKLKKEKLVKELIDFESKTYTLQDHFQYNIDMNRVHFIIGQLSLYDDIIIHLMEEKKKAETTL